MTKTTKKTKKPTKEQKEKLEIIKTALQNVARKTTKIYRYTFDEKTKIERTMEMRGYRLTLTTNKTANIVHLEIWRVLTMIKKALSYKGIQASTSASNKAEAGILGSVWGVRDEDKVCLQLHIYVYLEDLNK